MPLYRFIYLNDSSKETYEAIQGNQILPGDLSYIVFEAAGDVEANEYIEDQLIPKIEKDRGSEIQGWAHQRGDSTSTKENFNLESLSNHGLFVTATMRRELGIPQRFVLVEYLLGIGDS